MNQFILTILLIAAAGGVFFGYTNDKLSEIEDLQAEKVELDKAVEKMRELNEVRDVILEKRAAISREDIERLGKALPDNVDNVKLVNDLDGIAEEYGMSIRNAKVTFEKDATGDIVVEEKKYSTVIVEFSVSGSYQTFLSFLNKLERSLRVVDVTKISFSSVDTDFYEYTIQLKTYWLRSL
jgi:Tfp pilus assembly protein PilO